MNIKVNFLPKRMCLLSLLILSLVITNAYAGQILSFLTTPTYWRDINTLEEVALQIDGLQSPRNLFSHFEEEALLQPLKTLHRKTEIMPSKDRFNRSHVQQMLHHLEEMRRSGKVALVLSKSNSHFFTQLREVSDGTQVDFHLVPECVVSPGFEAPTIAKGDAWYEVANAFFSHLMEGGFYNQWRALQRHRMAANGLTRPPLPGGGGAAPEPLVLAQVAGPFLVLALGLAVAATTLAVERRCATNKRCFPVRRHSRRFAWN